MKRPQTRNSFIGILVLLASYPAYAGHGFMSSFGNIEWLPEPGRTPDSVWYQLDTWYEKGQLLMATTPQDVVELSLTFAREKLAEAEAMLTAQDTTAAQVAAGQYWNYVDYAEQAISAPASAENEKDADTIALVETLTTDLLEHQYILTIIYTELPLESRSVLRDVLATAQKRYAMIADRLPRKKRGALFFKEEEVRWSIEMAIRTDEQSM